MDIGDPVSTTPETTAPEPVTEVTVDVVDIDLPPEDLILPATEPTSADATGDRL